MGRSRSRLALLALLALASPAACRAIIGLESGDPVIDTSLLDAGGGGEDAGDPDAAPPDLSCASYCAAAKSACMAPHSLYPSDDACALLCPFMDVGTLSDVGKDTLGCRIKLAKSIAINGELDSCPGAGPGGDDHCGTNCDSFCKLALEVCAGQPGIYADLAACEADCATIPDNHDYHVVSTDLPDDFSIQCRLRHVNSAAIDSPEVHCMHVMGIGKCGKPDGG